MIDSVLHSRLRRAARRQRILVLTGQLALCWLAAALLGLGMILIRLEWGWASMLTLPILAALVAGLSSLLVIRWAYRGISERQTARAIEHRYPDLKGVLLTAVQQQIPQGGSATYLQQRVIDLAVGHSRERDWRDIVPRWRMALVQIGHLAAFVGLLAVLRWELQLGRNGGSLDGLPGGMVVTPGDASIERGESLVVLARFGGALPPGVNLIVHTSGEAPRQIALVKSLADPVFGTSIPEVDHDLVYRLEYGEHQTRDYHITVFEHPRLEQANAQLTYPTYTKLAPKRIENTRRISAVEGTKLDLDLRLNKPVVSATLVAHDANKTAIPLRVAEGKAVATLPAFSLQKSQVYDLKLVDREGRTNPLATPMIIDVQPNRPPELHVTSPRGDLRPSAVEEITFTGNLLGEFGVSSYGLAYTLAGGETKFVELGSTVPALEKRAFNYTLRLEDLGVKPDQLLSWYVWADDTGPDNQRRRTAGDLFFAEIRRFDETFRENQGMESPESPAGEAGGQSQKLAELQKQIISATWKLQRSVNEAKYVDDAQVVQDSQNQALSQAIKEQAQAEDPRAQELWSAVANEMLAANVELKEAVRTPKALSVALANEQAAYQSLLRLQPLVTQVSRRRGRGGQGGGGSDQRQLAQLDLTQEKNRYETEKQATAAQTPERTAQLQVMNRLQELARRQQDVNDRLKEMQTALQEAKTESEREDLKRQLKRLQEEQQQVVADADELRQRMDELQNQANLSEQRRQLEQTRGEAQSAADAAAQGQVSEALAAGTRAQRQFQTMRDQLHQQNSNQFSDELKGIRGAARELAQKEDELSQKLAGSTGSAGAGPKPLSDDGAEAGPAQDLAEQKRRMTDLVNRAKQVSQEAESSEPLLSEKLYDTVRKLAQEDSGTAKEFQQSLLNSGLLTRSLNDRLTDEKATEGTKSIDLTSGLLQKGYRTQATEAEQRTREEIDHLKSGMEDAASSVIGDDTAALKLAQSELDTVTQQLKAEAQAAGDPAKRSDSARGQKGEAQTMNGAALAGVAAGDATQPGGKSAAADDQAAATNGAVAAAAKQSTQRGHAPSLAGESRPAEAGSPEAADGQDQGVNVANSPASGGSRLGGAAGGRTARGPVGPITGEGYAQWSDRLRTVEEIVDAPDLRNAVATAREHARLLRQDYARSGHRPDWEELNLQIVKPLLDVRNQIADELARRGSKESLVPIDRDPVPNRYAESVRKYYEELGKDK